MSVPTQLLETLGATYEFQRELGGGGMSRVFLAQDKRLGRRIVVKVLSPELASTVSTERFEREIRTAATLQQANIVPLLDAGDASGMPYFTMPYVEGESVRARLAKGASLSIPEVISVLRDVARALVYAHEHGVVHRDIKPDNILLSGGAAVVTDFGLAKALTAARREPGQSTLTQLGTAVGTPAYMAPEQVAADGSVDDHADMYALGCTAYEMLAGMPPFTGANIHQLLAAHIELEPRDIRQLRPKIPAALAELVMQCLEKTPADRPTASDMLRRLETVATATVTVAAESSAPALTRRAFLFYAIAFIAVAVVARAAVSLTGLPDWAFAGALIVMALGLPVLILTALGRSPHLTWRRAAIGGVMALGSFIAIVAGYMTLRLLGIGPAGSLLAAGRMQPKQPVLVADFRSPGPDSTLGGVVAEAIRADLNQSTAVKVVPPARITAALQRMQKPASTRLDVDVARDLARREGIGAIIDGEVRPLGAGFLVSIRLTQTDSAQTLATFQQSANSPADLIPTLGALSKKLRGKIGESLKDVRESEPLEQVTTSSLAALQKFDAANRALNEQNYARFKANMEEAIALDSGFAMAYRRLATEMSNRGDAGRLTEFLMKKAVEHSDRLVASERYLAISSYWLLSAHEDFDKAMDALQRVVEMDSSNANALNNIGLVYAGRRQFRESLEWYERARDANPDLATPYLNLSLTKFVLGGVPALREHVREMQQKFPTRPLTGGMFRAMVAAEGYLDSAAAMYEKRADPNAAGGPSEPASYNVARIRHTQGRVADATEWYRRLNQVRANRGARATDAQLVLERAWIEGWLLGRRDRAASTMDSLLASPAYRTLDVTDKKYDWVATVYAMAGRPDRARAVLAEAGLVDGWSSNRESLNWLRVRELSRHSTLGWIALAENRPADAVREFRAADIGDCLTCALPMIAVAYDRAGNADSAIVVYERFLDTKELFRDGDADHLASTYKRLGELYEARGERQKAAGYYLKFVELWKNADPRLQPVVADVRRRLQRLKDVEQ